MGATEASDGRGGTDVVYSATSTVQAAIVPDSGAEQLVAQERKWNGSYSVYTKKSVVLTEGDIIQQDGIMYRIQPNWNKQTPPMGLDLRVMKAEVFKP